VTKHVNSNFFRGNCKLAIPYCINQSDDICLECETNYFSINTSCIICGTTQVFDNINLKCVEMINNCSKYNSDESCLECESNYELKNAICELIPDPDANKNPDPNTTTDPDPGTNKNPDPNTITDPDPNKKPGPDPNKKPDPIPPKTPEIYPLPYKSGVFEDSNSPSGIGYCMKGCSFCLNSSTCELCLKEYYLYEKKCFNCPPNCHKCFNSLVCIQCNTGYYLHDNLKCVESFYFSNNPNQETDDSGKKPSLIQNVSNDEVKQNILQKELVNFKELEGCTVYSLIDGTCMRCRPEYYRHHHECRKCMTGCAYCDREPICLVCENNFKRLQKDERIYCQEVEVSPVSFYSNLSGRKKNSK
jgi:ubiquitin